MTAKLQTGSPRRVRHGARLPMILGRGLSPLPAVALVLLLIACQASPLDPPRAATLTAQAALAPTHTPTPLLSTAPTATPGGAEAVEPSQADPLASEPGSALTFWVGDAGGSGVEMLEQGAADFSAETGIQVEVVRVANRLLPELMASAVLSNTLPDLVLHPAELSHGWADRGVLDSEAATAVLQNLGRETFDTDAVAQLEVDGNDGLVAALPSDGWQQLLIYRTDWFDELDLPPPATYTDLAAAAEAIHETDSPISGLIVPTDSSLVSTQHVFEHLAIANGCRLASPEGEVTLLQPACLEALEFYRALINDYSPIGLQTDISALSGYLSGRTGIIAASPAVLPAIAGLSVTDRPSCPQCTVADYLATNSGLVTKVQGASDLATPANFSSITALGITSAADRPAAMSFAEYWFDELYPQWLAVNPELKVPMRVGTQNDATLFVDQWSQTPLTPDGATLADIYGIDIATRLSQDVAAADRWGLANQQGSLVTSLYEELLIAPLLQDMLSGYFTSSQTIVEMYLAVVNTIPGYDFPIQVVPTPTP
ncbi:MAG: extracellular solute-binding protein [Chloroflexota bacterium]|nr:MAG: extracellular solute-binding protein [Chloroflexota bacterium]